MSAPTNPEAMSNESIADELDALAGIGYEEVNPWVSDLSEAARRLRQPASADRQGVAELEALCGEPIHVPSQRGMELERASLVQKLTAAEARCVDTIGALDGNTERPDFAKRSADMEDALREIAAQKLSTEMEVKERWRTHFETACDMAITTARAALSKTAGKGGAL